MDHYCDPTWPVARKRHRCTPCGASIPIGETYVQQSGFFDGAPFRNRYHAECWEELSSEGIFEFSPGSLDPPERLLAPEALGAPCPSSPADS